jgi:hypothetical protein
VYFIGRAWNRHLNFHANNLNHPNGNPAISDVRSAKSFGVMTSPVAMPRLPLALDYACHGFNESTGQISHGEFQAGR